MFVRTILQSTTASTRLPSRRKMSRCIWCISGERHAARKGFGNVPTGPASERESRPGDAHRTRSVLTAGPRESGAAARAAHATIDLLSKTAKPPRIAPWGLLLTDPRPLLATREKWLRIRRRLITDAAEGRKRLRADAFRGSPTLTTRRSDRAPRRRRAARGWRPPREALSDPRGSLRLRPSRPRGIRRRPA